MGERLIVPPHVHRNEAHCPGRRVTCSGMDSGDVAGEAIGMAAVGMAAIGMAVAIAAATAASGT